MKNSMPKPDRDTPRPVSNSGEELGEGNRTAAKRYNAGVQETVKNKDVDKLASEAADALEGPEGEELREAEEKAKKGPQTGTNKKA